MNTLGSIPFIRRGDLIPCSEKSSWARLSRFDRNTEQWASDAKAVATVDAHTFELYSYHPAPINDLRYSVNAHDVGARLTKKRHAAIDTIKKQLKELAKEQDGLWANSGKLSPGRESAWDELEEKASDLKRRLMHEFGVTVKDVRKPKPSSYPSDPVVRQDNPVFRPRSVSEMRSLVMNGDVRTLLLGVLAMSDRVWKECGGDLSSDADCKAMFIALNRQIDWLRDRLYL